ncbi:hypothetical protein ACQ4M3_09715 [Leptolyngbya sp. AN03gr2]|uniref:hypothetical protein n=1 Tax=Leptolyngbya sp. AN03gr2 TaxID=3423364 RepID=UPI003D3222CD
MLKEFRVSFDEFVEDVYGYNFHEMDFDFDLSEIEVTEKEVSDAAAAYPNHNLARLRKSLQLVKHDNYVSSWLEEYKNAAIGLFKEKIKQDFSNLTGFFEAEANEIPIEGEIKVRFEPRPDCYEQIVFDNSDQLVALLINVMRGDGRFWFDSVEDFFEVNNHKEANEVIASHLFWLQKTESIYDTYYKLFRFDVQEALKYRSDMFGNFNYTLEDLEVYIARAATVLLIQGSND